MSRFRPTIDNIDERTYGNYYDTPESVTLTRGTVTNPPSSGTVAEVATMHDGSFYQCTEVNSPGNPGIELVFDYRGVTAIKGIAVRAYYNGVTTHAVRIEIYDFVNSAWRTVHTMMTTLDWMQHFKAIPDGYKYIDHPTGNAKLQFIHDEQGTGAGAHQLYIDFAAFTH